MSDSILKLNFRGGGSADINFGDENTIAIELRALPLGGTRLKLVTEGNRDKDVESMELISGTNASTVSVRVIHPEWGDSKVDGVWEVQKSDDVLTHTIGRFDAPGWTLPVKVRKRGG